VIYLSSEQVLFIHSRLIDETGGAHGVRDLGLLQSGSPAKRTGAIHAQDGYRKKLL